MKRHIIALSVMLVAPMAANASYYYLIVNPQKWLTWQLQRIETQMGWKRKAFEEQRRWAQDLKLAQQENQTKDRLTSNYIARQTQVNTDLFNLKVLNATASRDGLCGIIDSLRAWSGNCALTDLLAKNHTTVREADYRPSPAALQQAVDRKRAAGKVAYGTGTLRVGHEELGDYARAIVGDSSARLTLSEAKQRALQMIPETQDTVTRRRAALQVADKAALASTFETAAIRSRRHLLSANGSPSDMESFQTLLQFSLDEKNLTKPNKKKGEILGDYALQSAVANRIALQRYEDRQVLLATLIAKATIRLNGMGRRH